MERFPFILGMLIALLVGQKAFAGPGTTDEQRVIDSQIEAFLGDRYDEAYSYAAPNVRMIFPDVNSFMGMVRGGYQPVYRPKTWSHARSRVADDGQVYQEVLITDQQGQNWAALYSLQKQPDGRWKITGVALRKADAISM